MTDTYTTPQQAEDAFYDALDEGDPDKLLSVWADSDDINCLLPMQPVIQGRKGVAELFSKVLSGGRGVSLSIQHLGWIETDDIAIHHVEETVLAPAAAGQQQAPLYGINIYRKQAGSWRLIVHMNSPTPPAAPEFGGQK
jgi:uncharacterized protein (TIGR02246 family)